VPEAIRDNGIVDDANRGALGRQGGVDPVAYLRSLIAEPETEADEAQQRPARSRKRPSRYQSDSPEPEETAEKNVTPAQNQHKRSRNNHPEEPAAKKAKSRETKMSQAKTVHYDEVYQGGEAKHKEMIVDFPKGSGREWYILRCDEHNMQFGKTGKDPLAGAAKHLNGAAHGNLSKARELAVERLGIRVEGCDYEKAERNNEALLKSQGKALPASDSTSHRAARSGNGSSKKPKRRPRPSNAAAGSSDSLIVPDDSTVFLDGPKSLVSQSNFRGVGNAEPGKMYLGWWKREGWFAVLILPWGSFDSVGLRGSMKESKLSKNSSKPRCLEWHGKSIVGWQPGYEDGGDYVSQRRFPVMWFVENQESPDKEDFATLERRFGWIEAKNLRPFNEIGPDDNPPLGYHVAEYYSERLDAMREEAGHSGGSSAT
jgi:hypothetical protein